MPRLLPGRRLFALATHEGWLGVLFLSGCLAAPVPEPHMVVLGLRLGNGWRVGAAFFHLSNAGLFDSNPGTEAVAVTLAIPLGGSG